MMNGTTAVNALAPSQSGGSGREQASRPELPADDGSPSFSQTLQQAMARQGKRLAGGRWARGSANAGDRDQSGAGFSTTAGDPASGLAWPGEPVVAGQMLAIAPQEQAGSVISPAPETEEAILTSLGEDGALEGTVLGDSGNFVASGPGTDEATAVAPGSLAEQPGSPQESRMQGQAVPGDLSGEPAPGKSGGGPVSVALTPREGHAQKAIGSMPESTPAAQPGFWSAGTAPGSEGESRFQALKPWWAIEAELLLKTGSRGYIRSGVALQSREVGPFWSMPSQWGTGHGRAEGVLGIKGSVAAHVAPSSGAEFGTHGTQATDGELAVEGGPMTGSRQGTGPHFLQLASQQPGSLSLGWARNGGGAPVHGGPLVGSAASGAWHEATYDGVMPQGHPALPAQDGAVGTYHAVDLPGVAATHSGSGTIPGLAVGQGSSAAVNSGLEAGWEPGHADYPDPGRGLGVSDGGWEVAARWANRPVDGTTDGTRADGGLAKAIAALESGSAASLDADPLADEATPAGAGRRSVSAASTGSTDSAAVGGVSTGRQPGYGAQDGNTGSLHPPGTAGEALNLPSSEGADRSARAFQEILARSDTLTAETVDSQEGPSASGVAWGNDARVQDQMVFPVSEAGGEATTSGSPDWTREVVRLVQRARPDGTQEAFLQLQPEHLGKLLVRVTVQQGRVSVQIRAESESTEALLRSHLGLLRHALEEYGLRLDHVQLETLGRDDYLSQAGYQGQGHHSGEHPRNPQPARPAWGAHRSYQGEDSAAGGVQPVGAAGLLHGRSGIDLRA